MSIQITTDSCSGITPKEAERLGIGLIPIPFMVNDTEYQEGDGLSLAELFEVMDDGAKVSTSQPSPVQVMALWDEALKDHEQVVHIPISSGLSGSCAAATNLAAEPPYVGRVFVVDNGRVSTPLYRSVLDALALVHAGYDGAQIKRELEAAKDSMSIYVAASTLEYLKRGGRISPTTATIGSLLGVRPILKLDTGILSSFKNVHGLTAAKRTMIKAMQHDLETRFSHLYERGEVYLLAATNTEEEVTKLWIKEIEAAFPGMLVQHSVLPLGISCHLGPGALGIGCSCLPDALCRWVRQPYKDK